ncbi:S-adenosyl-L-methionine-dependent methyltransferase [Aspergillus coremiiformis]|uniref:S-adenosyl-L-methionine-dependent methyltransferase n=1 Tax=Aspergillus coremiiformis TaxID=138285 RepID=A0A5N6ZFX2_9EURO|nr:S-adenosyl-L-methionine-dependent methyltransferase [Aspergillus coremiiformis]
MAHNNSQAEQLGARISESIRRYSEKLQAGETPEEEILRISSACRELDVLVTPPESWTNQIAMAYNSTVSMCLLLDLNIFQLLSEKDEPTALDTLVERSGSSRSLLRCALKECVARCILDEPSPEVYKLNSRSACLLNENGAAWIHYLCDVGLFTGAHLSRYITENDGQIPSHRHQTAFQMAYQTDKQFYPFFRSCDRKRAERFDKAMQWSSRGSAATPVENIFDFSQLKSDAVVVDVGGGSGHHAIRIARQNPHLSFIVQDLGVAPPLDEDSETPRRVQWQQHDFYNEQPVKGADLYFLGCILMDNTLGDCCKILGHLANAMTPKKSILLIDDALDSGEDYNSLAGALNMHLLACFGTLSRTMEEWEKLFSEISCGLSIVNRWTVNPGRVTFAVKRTS